MQDRERIQEAFESALWELQPEYFEFTGEGEVGAPGSVNCAQVSTDCAFMTKEEERRIKRSSNRVGAFHIRTQGDTNINLGIQLVDYDINDWFSRKPKHAEALAIVREFIEKRGRESDQGIEVSITGSASRTGTKQYNDILSCKRANCVADNLRQSLGMLNPGLLARTKINPSGDGFSRATCNGRECELPEFRSVLVQVHAPGRKPGKIDPVPVKDEWDKFKIRCCMYKSEKLFEGLLGDLLDKSFDQLPEPLKRILANNPRLRSMFEGLIKKLANRIKVEALKKLPRLGQALRGLEGFLKFIPLELIRDTAVFQIIEREKPNPKQTTYCYTGFGFRVPLPRFKDLIAQLDQLPLPALVKKLLKEALNKLIPPSRVPLPPFETTVPGPFADFDLNRKVPLSVFAGDVFIGKGITVGKVFLVFGSPAWRRPDPLQRPRIVRCGTECRDNTLAVQAGDGRAFELFAVNEGSFNQGDCKCEEQNLARFRRPVIGRSQTFRAARRF
jgi:hypothetical protein